MSHVLDICFFSAWRASRVEDREKPTEQRREAKRRRKVCLRVHFKSHTCGETYCFRHLSRSMILEKAASVKKKIFFCLYLCIIWFFAFFASQTWNLIKYVLLASACAYVCGNRDSNKNHVIHSQQLSVYNVLPSLPPWPFRALSFSCKS